VTPFPDLLPAGTEAVLLDYCGVLARPAALADFRRLAAIAGADPLIFRSAYWRHRVSYDRDTLDCRSYWRTVGTDCGLDLSSGTIAALVTADIEINTAVRPAVARQVRDWAGAGLKIGVLSNLPLQLADRVREQPEWRSVVGVFAFSCDLRLAKPDPRAFSSALRLLGCAYDRACFVDDRVVNVRAARQLGIPSLHWRA
jgi:putative hydrolase of the HAD superfamily